MIKLLSCICKKVAPHLIGLKLAALKLISMMHGISRSKEGHNNIPLSQTRTGSISGACHSNLWSQLWALVLHQNSNKLKGAACEFSS